MASFSDFFWATAMAFNSGAEWPQTRLLLPGNTTTIAVSPSDTLILTSHLEMLHEENWETPMEAYFCRVEYPRQAHGSPTFTKLGGQVQKQLPAHESTVLTIATVTTVPPDNNDSAWEVGICGDFYASQNEQVWLSRVNASGNIQVIH